MKIKKLFIVFMLYASPVCGTDFFQAGPAGMAGAYIAVGQSADVVMINSAATHQIKRKQVAASYANLYPGLATDSINLNEVSAVIPFKNNFNLSFAWQQMSSDRYRSSIFQGGLSADIGKMIPFITHPILLSLDGVVYQRHYISNAFTAIDPVFSTGQTKTAGTMNINFYGEILPRFTWGVVFHNVLRADLGLKQDDFTRREGGVGLAYRFNTALLAIDVTADAVNTTIRAGAEKSLFSDRFQFRTGYAFGENRLSNFSTGIGLKINRSRFLLRINYAFTLSLTGAAEGTAGIHQLGGVLEF